jgi:hypothetical protein
VQRAILIALAAFLVVPSAANADCPAPRDPIYEDSRTIVYASGGKYRACLRRAGRPVTLSGAGHLTYDRWIYGIRTAGRFVSFGINAHDPRDDHSGPALESVEVVDLGSGKTFAYHAVGEWVAPAWETQLMDSELRASGSLAYITSRNDGRSTLHRMTPKRVRLDRGVGIDPWSLNRRGDTITWLHDGATRRSTLR